MKVRKEINVALTIKHTADEAVTAAVSLLGYNYIYGYKYSYNPVTKERIKLLASQNPKMFTDSYYNKACQFVGKNAIDCSGLVCFCLGINDIGSYEIYERATSKDGMRVVTKDEVVKFGDVLWKQGHVGLVTSVSTDSGFMVHTIEAKTINAPVKYYAYNGAKYAAPSGWSQVIRPDYKVIMPEPVKPERNTGWQKDNDGRWWYSTGKDKGDYLRNGFYNIAGKDYYFDKEGYLCIPEVAGMAQDGSIDKVEYEYYYDEP